MGTVLAHLSELNPKRFFLETWREMDAEAAELREQRRAEGKGWDWGPLVALCTGAVFLTLMEYFGGSRTYLQIIRAMQEDAAPDSIWFTLRSSKFSQLFEFCWWSGWRALGYFLLPVLVTKLMGWRIRDQGLSMRGLWSHMWIYGVFLCIVLPLVAGVSFRDDFSNYYPFYKQASRSWFDFVAWELLYFLQFFSLEFFFRGWWLQACKRMMGSHAIFAMVVPYCMIHFGKPWMEALAAIVAGIVLGTLAMKTRSIWNGVFIHCTVAVAMDAAALLQTGAGLPEQWWPGG